MLKRTFDLTLGSLLVIGAVPLLLFVALAIRATDSSPVLFRQVRVGKDGARFTLIKFRTMRVVPDGGPVSQFQPGETSRVSKIGALLRRTKLDELPQLWNVLRGDMSLVGPRPEVERWTSEYPELWQVVHTVRPGLTDLASIEFRDEERLLAGAADPDVMYRDVILPRKLQLAVRYINERSLPGDVMILAHTAWAVVAR